MFLELMLCPPFPIPAVAPCRVQAEQQIRAMRLPPPCRHSWQELFQVGDVLRACAVHQAISRIDARNNLHPPPPLTFANSL